ncbi:NAD(P)/FAD-dependent oxidoreductase [Algiphilus sp. W345]|uniref:NAD(P)/FAD-dependent oxidoreductase n=1 Tax=Banduia mediterranea TaxID=3075609 RepID=A0ABU2WFL5_9GAMM|nr:NAD(P)/FAD-dependent oxidoreductase [Algiphilus sp. W345]MDT0496409.1 NAD(P)/FAD-dependent oxidoreductase [Algiphilus sp. W345]
MPRAQFDVIILGAGLSGIGAACHLKSKIPGIRLAILERRERMGGTWDLFKYPGIRSDSDMFTLGYDFRPWTDTKLLADGPAIRQYIEDAAEEYGIRRDIRFGHKITRVSWSGSDKLWTVTAVKENSQDEEASFTASFVYGCTGYYKYDKGYTPEFPGVEQFKGDVIHPQHWPENYDYSGKRVVVIGSGATAVTLVPSMTDKAAHVTMLQRSPSYVVSVPERDLITEKLRKVLPDSLTYRMARVRNVVLQRAVFDVCRRAPKTMRRVLLASVRKQLGPNVDFSHFEPRYNPWDERMCAVPKGDLFKALRDGKASVVTDGIESITQTGIRLKSGRELEADIIVTATGLDMQLLGGAEYYVDERKLDLHETLMYKGILLEGVPNFALVFGYTNASWTLKANIANAFVVRVIRQMRQLGADTVVPEDEEGCASEENFLNLRSGYIQRANDRLPRQGTKQPWQNLQNYLLDVPALRFGSLDDGVLRFYRDGRRVSQSPVQRVTSLLAA